MQTINEFNFANEKAKRQMLELSAKLKQCKTNEEFKAWEQEKNQIHIWVDSEAEINAIKAHCRMFGIPSPKMSVRFSEKPYKGFATKKPPK